MPGHDLPLMTPIDPPLDRKHLTVFFALKPGSAADRYRPLRSVLRALGIRLVGGTTRRSVLWSALGLAEEQDPAHHEALSAPLMTARGTADLLGVADPSIVYQWRKGRVPQGMPTFPAAIDLSGGRENARMLRWRRSEVLAWRTRRPAPAYASPLSSAPRTAVFGGLAPIRGRASPAPPLPDMPLAALATGSAPKRPGHMGPSDCTGGNA